MRIGLFLNNLDEEYQLSVYKGIKTEAAALGLELICVQGESLPQKLPEPAEENRLQEFFPSRHIIGADGILFLSSVLFSRAAPDYTAELKDMFKNTPFVSVGDRLCDYHSILIDSEKPMWDLMEHLIALHKYRKFLFIGGPAEHPDNIVRETIFREAIEKHRPAFPDIQGTVANGDFVEMSGVNIARDYMNLHPDAPPDAIVAANDAMANGARNMLLTREDPRWSKCPVTGFDDISQSGMEIPTLTTIRQPLDEMGKLGVRTLYDIIRGNDAPLTITADAKLIIRNSCGCPLKSDQKTANLAQYRAIYHLRYISALGKSLTEINTFDEMFNPLSCFLTNLEIPLFFLIVYEKPRSDLSTEGKLIYERTPGNERFSFKGAPEINIKDFFKGLGSYSGASGIWCLRYLRSGSEYLGLVIYEASDLIHPQLCNGLILLSNTVKRLFSNREEMDRRRFSMDLHEDISRRLEEISIHSKNLAAGKYNGDKAAALEKLSALIDETLLRTRHFSDDDAKKPLES